MTTNPSTDAITDQWIDDHFDLLSPALARDLHPTLARARARCPVAHSDQRRHRPLGVRVHEVRDRLDVGCSRRGSMGPGRHQRRPQMGGRAMHSGTGERLAQALATKDRPGLLDLLDPEIDFRGLTPNRFWEASSAEALVDDIILGAWFEPDDRIDALEDVQLGSVADRDRVAYRLRVVTPDGVFLVEPQAYFGVENDRITWLRIMCSGFRAVAPERPDI